MSFKKLPIDLLTRVSISINPLSPGNGTARELLARLSHDSVKKVNPKLEVQFNILRHLAPPMVEFKFANGDEEVFNTRVTKLHEIEGAMSRKGAWIRLQEDLKEGEIVIPHFPGYKDPKKHPFLNGE